MERSIRVSDPEGRRASLFEHGPDATLARLRADDGREAWIDPVLVDGDRLAITLEHLLEGRSTLALLEERLDVEQGSEERHVLHRKEG